MLHYLSRGELADRAGVRLGSLGRITLPEPDAMIGPVPGWLPDTVDAWAVSHLGREHRPGGVEGSG